MRYQFRVVVPEESSYPYASGVSKTASVSGAWGMTMLSWLRRHLTYANVCASLALFIALGGTGYAAFKLPRDSVGSRELRSDSVGASELRANAVTSSSVRDGSIAIAGSLGDGARVVSPGRRAARSRGRGGTTGASWGARSTGAKRAWRER